MREFHSTLRSPVTSVQLGKEHDSEFDCDLSAVSPKCLGKLIDKIEVFKYNNSAEAELTEKQASVMLAKLNGRSNLKKLEIFHDNHLSLIVPDKLASAFTSLNELTLGEIPPEDDKYFCLFSFSKTDH